jgi:hypothetical protein
MSSKSRAASRPMFATLSEKSRIVDPKVGTERKLYNNISTITYT